MVYCRNCNVDSTIDVDGTICCSFCGRVLDDANFSSEVTFSKDSSGQSRANGSNVRFQTEYSASRGQILERARNGMDMMLVSLNEQNRDSIVNAALKFYTIALERNFTKGRRYEYVEAACLYLACRENKKPYLLIDFSLYLQISVYIVGAVFLELCKLLSLQEHPIVQKPLDPSLYIHRYANALVGPEHYKDVSRDALHIISGMKRDWMQTGRKPGGLCGAALYISAISHCGRKFSKSDIQRIVHVCEATLKKRLIEFEDTESGSLTIEEFVKNAESQEREFRSMKEAPESILKEHILVCEHKGSGTPVFSRGLCRACYSEFIELSGGFDGGSDPPAFQRAERQRKAKESAKEELIADELAYDTLNVEKEPDTFDDSQTEQLKHGHSDASDDGNKHVEADDGFDKFQEDISKSKDSDDDEPENFADIDDIEVDGYINNEREQQFKKIIWEQLNKEYLEEQAAKEAAAAAEKAAYEASLSNDPDDVRARELAAAANARVAQTRKEKQQKRAAELKNAAPPKNAAEATKQMLTRKRLSSKINYDVLEKLFEEDPIENPEKIQKREDKHKLESIKEVEEEDNSGYGQDYGAYDEVEPEEYYFEPEF